MIATTSCSLGDQDTSLWPQCLTTRSALRVSWQETNQDRQLNNEEEEETTTTMTITTTTGLGTVLG